MINMKHHSSMPNYQRSELIRILSMHHSLSELANMKIHINKQTMAKNEEEKLQIEVCEYIMYQYPDVIFTSDSAGVRLTQNQAKKAKKMRSDRGYPDLFIAEPIGSFSGLYLELKKEGEVIYKKDGTLRASEHLERQQNMIHRLRNKGYVAEFAVGFDACKRLIDSYLG